MWLSGTPPTMISPEQSARAPDGHSPGSSFEFSEVRRDGMSSPSVTGSSITAKGVTGGHR
jgi:hypothetical protein